MDIIGEGFILKSWHPTPLEEAILNGEDLEIIDESAAEFEEIPEDLLEWQEIHEAMEELKKNL